MLFNLLPMLLHTFICVLILTRRHAILDSLLYYLMYMQSTPRFQKPDTRQNQVIYTLFIQLYICFDLHFVFS